MEKNLVTASGTIIMEGHGSLGTFLCKEFSLKDEIVAIPLDKPCLALTQGKIVDTAGRCEDQSNDNGKAREQSL